MLATDLMDGFRFFRLNPYWAVQMADGETRLLRRYDQLLDALPRQRITAGPRR
ncbi:MAG: hypothetical protein ACOVKS_09770 [Aquimonas sp.]